MIIIVPSFETQNPWGISSAGRAPALHAGGQEFESPILHHLNQIRTRLYCLWVECFDYFDHYNCMK